jgi:DNA-binding transcriptional MocR family regulator
MHAPDLLARIGSWDDGEGSVSRRLARAVEAAIADGRLPAGVRLPAERELAGAIGVSRGTVVRAYARLREDGLAATTHGAGTRVGGPRSDGAIETAIRADGIVAAVGHRDEDTIDLRVAAWAGDEELAHALAGEPATQAAAVQRHDGYYPEGLPTLRTALAQRLTGLGLPTDPDQLVVTNGAQQAIDVVLTSIARPGDPVLLEETTWPGLVELLPVRHLRPTTVPLAAADHIGLLRALRERRADVAYLIPSFHNPTGLVVPAPVRRLIVEAAASSGTVVIEDLTLAELWIDQPPPPPLAMAVPEAAGQVVTIGSLSKSLWGGLRLGWIRAEGRLLRHLTSVKTVIDLGTGVPSQLAAARALNVADRIVARRRTGLAERRDRVLAARAPPGAGGGAGAPPPGPRAARPLRADRRGRPHREDLFRRHAAPA